jgi:hypothetical protein
VPPTKIIRHALGTTRRVDDDDQSVSQGSGHRVSELPDDGTLLVVTPPPDVVQRSPSAGRVMINFSSEDRDGAKDLPAWLEGRALTPAVVHLSFM